MKVRKRNRAAARGRRVGGALVGALVVAACVCCWLGCSVERDRKLLSVFFDGVPDPNAPAKAQTAGAGGMGGRVPTPYKVGQVIASSHKPFVEGKCSTCHAGASQFQFTSMTSEVCMKCHEPVLTKHRAMHGAVVGKACLWCHDAHESASVSLLKTTDTSLCVQCHDWGTLTQRVEGHGAKTSAKCLDCHTGHGGERLPFLRADAGTTRPAAK